MSPGFAGAVGVPLEIGTSMKQQLAVAIALAACSLVLASSSPAAPDDVYDLEETAGECLLHRELSPERLLRRLSLDLRGRVPLYEEYALVENESGVPEDVIDDFLESDGFRHVMRRYHELLLWPNPTNVILLTNNFSLQAVGNQFGNPYHIGSTTKRIVFRGGNGSHSCQLVHQDALGWNADGTPMCQAMGNDNIGPYCQEGYVDVHPYWEADPNATVKVCAFDAQETASYNYKGNQLSCGQRYAANEAVCGCGPNLRHCLLGSLQGDITSQWRAQFLRLVDDYTDGSRDYTEMLTTKRGYTNGRIEFHRKYLAPQTGYSYTYTEPGGSDPPPAEDPDWHDLSWTEVERGVDHSGILTLPGYTLRFQTNRSRANRFRTVFAGQYFQPPQPESSGCDPEATDLTTRCTCRKCHSVLEPLAAHFGVITQAGSTPLTDFIESFDSEDECNNGGLEPDTSFCSRFYKRVRDEVDPDISSWKLEALEFADAAHPEIQTNYDQGPAGIVSWAQESGLLYRATVQNMFRFLMKREMILTPSGADSEAALLEELSAEFASHDNLKELVKRIVQLPQYRRMP